MSLVKRFLAKQLRHPSGWFGRKVLPARLDKENLSSNLHTLDLLALDHSDHVLEIGFGSGFLLRQILKTVQKGKVTGLDLSKDMVEMAKKSFCQEIAGEKLDVQTVYEPKLPLPSGSQDKVCAVHVIYFWEDIEKSLAEVHRVLKVEGRVVITIHSRDKMLAGGIAKYGFHLFDGEDVKKLLESAGFSDVSIHQYDRDDTFDVVCVSGRKPKPS